MIAFDTNLLVRLVVDDDPAQADVVVKLLENERVLICCSVLLETEWVLRSRYRAPRARILAFFENLLQVSNVELERSDRIERALDWYRLGADFADAMHLATCGEAVMHTFDGNFCKAAREGGLAPAVTVLCT